MLVRPFATSTTAASATCIPIGPAGATPPTHTGRALAKLTY